MKNIAFYIMNSKGFYVFEKFIQKFGSKNIEYIVTNRDKKIHKDYFDEIISLAKKSNIQVFNRLDNFMDIEKKFNGYKIAIGWRWLIENEKELIIFHDSLLPRYRGFAPLVNSLINEESLIGVTALFANDEYDKGDILLQKSVKIEYPIKINEAIKLIEPIYFELVQNIYIQICNNQKLKAIKQNENDATYSLWLNDEDYFIDWNWSVQKIKRFVDSVGYPYDYAKAVVNNEIINLIDVEIIENVVVENRSRHIGKVIFIHDKSLVIVCKDGLLKINNMKNSNDSKTTLIFRSKFKNV